jgi:integrase
MGWIRQAPSGRWQARWRDPAGIERVQTFRLKSQARDFLTSIEDSKLAGAYRDPAAGREAFGHYLERFLASAVDLRPATKALYRTHANRYVLPALGSTPLATIRPADVRAFIADLHGRGVQPPTIQVAHRLLSRVLAQAVTDGIIPANPAARARPPRVIRKPPRILIPEELELLADSIDPRYRVLVLACGYGGLRFGEASALRRWAIRLLERRLDVLEALAEVRGELIFGPTKTGSTRSVQIPAFLADELANHVATYLRPPRSDRAGSDLIFTDPEGGPIRRSNWRRRFWQPAVEVAELDPAPTPHDLRHTAAAVAIAEGAHPKAIQARLGHGSIRTTLDLYGGLFPSLDVELADRLDAVRARAVESRAAQVRHESGAEVVELRARE